MSENKLKRKRHSDRKKKEVKGVKRVEKNAQESKKGQAEYGERNAKVNTKRHK